MKFTIYKISELIVHVPSEDFYAKKGDSQPQTIKTLVKIEEHSTMEDALDALKNDYLSKGEYVILPIYEIK